MSWELSASHSWVTWSYGKEQILEYRQCELCMHHCGYLCEICANPPFIPPPHLLVLVKVLLIKENPEHAKILWMFHLVQQVLIRSHSCWTWTTLSSSQDIFLMFIKKKKTCLIVNWQHAARWWLSLTCSWYSRLAG